MDDLATVTIYLVGGAVRDKLLNLPMKERDWVVVGATPDMLLSKGFKRVGKAFPVFLHPVTGEEYALARTEKKTGHGYSGFICDFSPTVTLKDDLLRRDLTVNAIAMSVDGKLIDPHGGVNDLKQKRLKHLSPAFEEDPVRILRVARFAAQYHSLGFYIDSSTALLMKKMVNSGEVAHLTPERVWKETEKGLSTQHPTVYFDVLLDCGALTHLFSGLTFDAITRRALNQVTQLTSDLSVRFSVLCGKMATANSIETLCEQLKIANHYKILAILTHRYRALVHDIKKLDAKQILSLLNGIDVWRHPERLTQLIIAAQSYEQSPDSDAESYDKGTYLLNAYLIAKQIDVKAIIEKGIVGQAIQEELQLARNVALSNWI